MNTEPAGQYCPIDSYLSDIKRPWVASDETNIARTFAREIAKLRGERPFIADDYADVERDHHMAFADGFKR